MNQSSNSYEECCVRYKCSPFFQQLFNKGVVDSMPYMCMDCIDKQLVKYIKEIEHITLESLGIAKDGKKPFALGNEYYFGISEQLLQNIFDTKFANDYNNPKYEIPLTLASKLQGLQKQRIQLMLLGQKYRIFPSKIDFQLLFGTGSEGSQKDSRIDEAILKKIYSLCLEFVNDKQLGLSRGQIKQIQSSFLPIGPESQNRYSWLSGQNIQDVLGQYQKVNPSYQFYGIITYDFNEYQMEDIIKNMNKAEESGKRFFGMVQNTCYMEDGGSHWLSILIDMKHHKMLYVDSLGKGPKKGLRNGKINPIFNFACLLRDYWRNKIGKETKMKFNEPGFTKTGKFTMYDSFFFVSLKKHQIEDGQCGVYSIYFQMLQPFIIQKYGYNWLLNYSIDGPQVKDKQMELFRDVIFIN